jgi:hypothetical protein
MSIYTGNNGRIYIARSQTSGLTGSRSITVSANKAVAKNEVLNVITVVGTGKGGALRASAAVGATDTSRAPTFTVRYSGSNYTSTDRVYLARKKEGTWERMSGDFTVGTVFTKGVDNETEILVDNYRIAKIRNWTYNSNSEVVETTALGDVVKTFAPSITSGDGSATLMFYEDDYNLAVNKQLDVYELVDILFPTSVPPRVIMNLSVDGGYSTVNSAELQKTNFLFNAYITSASVAVSYGDVVTIDTSFTVDGPLLATPNKPGVTVL